MLKTIDIPIKSKLFKNIDEEGIASSYAAQENCFINEAGGISRFPGHNVFCDIGGGSPVYPFSLGSDMIAVGGNGGWYRIDQAGNKERIKGASLLGKLRPVFTADESSLYAAAGDQIIRYDGEKTSILSKDAPIASHVQSIDNYLIANEYRSGRWVYSEASKPTSWPALNIFSAASKPDGIGAILITPFNEILVAGSESIEQFERLSTGTTPFFKRWSAGQGISEPYTLCYSDNAAWALNEDIEFVRISGQSGEVYSSDIAKDIEEKFSVSHISSHDKSWACSLKIKGQKFIILQFPMAVNSYGSLGVTYCLDVRQKIWFELFGWNTKTYLPNAWPGNSIHQLWGRTFAGGDGKIYELKTDLYSNAGEIQRVYARTAHYDIGTFGIESVTVSMKRGMGTNSTESNIFMRTKADNGNWSRWQKRPLGVSGDKYSKIEFGQQGIGDTWQFEFMVTDACPIEIRKVQAEARSVKR